MPILPTAPDVASVDVDVLVIGSGAAGLSAALSAAIENLNVMVIEKTASFGGTAARSGGMLWVPGNALAVRDGIEDSVEEARQYVQAEAKDVFNAEVVDSYLRHAPLMVDTYLREASAMTFVRNDAVADNHPKLPGAKSKGRTLTVPGFDARALGTDGKYLAPPLDTMTFLGMMVSARDLIHFFDIWRSAASFKLVMNKLSAHAVDLLGHGRAMGLANGSALVGRLAKSALDRGVPIWLNTKALRLEHDINGVTGAVVTCNDREIRVRCRAGVILATGGYAHDAERRKSLAPIPSLARQMYPMAKEGIDGDGLHMAEELGGKVEDRMFNTISWWPVSRVTTRKGHSLYAHGFDRSKPGFIMVNRKAQRFCSETAIGNDLIRALAQSTDDGPIEGYLLADHKAMRRFGIGIVRPAPLPFWHHLRSGYLTRAASIEKLAQKLGLDAGALAATVARFNLNAAHGEDPDFGRGESALDKRNGDAGNLPNPSLRALDQGPYYAVKILPGDFSTLAGLRTDGECGVIDSHGRRIDGLFAAGNDMNTMGGGNSPAGGFTLGPAVTFGFVAARAAAKRLAR